MFPFKYRLVFLLRVSLKAFFTIFLSVAEILFITFLHNSEFCSENFVLLFHLIQLNILFVVKDNCNDFGVTFDLLNLF